MSMADIYDLTEMSVAELKAHRNAVQTAASRVADDTDDDGYWKLTDELGPCRGRDQSPSARPQAGDGQEGLPRHPRWPAGAEEDRAQGRRGRAVEDR